jgi:hypothetical protein
MVLALSQAHYLRAGSFLVTLIACFSSFNRFGSRPMCGRAGSAFVHSLGVGSAFVSSGLPFGKLRVKKRDGPLPTQIRQRAAVVPTKRRAHVASFSTWQSSEAVPGGYTFVIVESPAKARTIQKFLDMKKFVVDSCMGHIRDLPGKCTQQAMKWQS